MIVRALVSAALAFLAMVLAIGGGKLAPPLGMFVILPGGVLAVALFSAMDAPSLLSAMGDDGPAVFAAATLVFSFLFWWAALFAVLAVRHKRKAASATET